VGAEEAAGIMTDKSGALPTRGALSTGLAKGGDGEAVATLTFELECEFLKSLPCGLLYPLVDAEEAPGFRTDMSGSHPPRAALSIGLAGGGREEAAATVLLELEYEFPKSLP
jgi:hypothetical protein